MADKTGGVRRVFQIGKSLALIVPSDMVKALGIKKHDAWLWTMEGDVLVARRATQTPPEPAALGETR